MAKKILRSWKKVFESDLPYVVSELKETIERPGVLILVGEVGSGKTTFCKFFIPDGEVQSPTYSVVSETPTTAHADFYRLKGPEEVMHLELNLYVEGKEYVLVEWGKKFFTVLDKELDEKFNFYELTIENNSSTQKPSRDYFLRPLERL